MPELPEVETISRTLREGRNGNPPVSGRTIEGVQVFWDKTLAVPGKEEYRQRILGQKIRGTSRRGKYLILELDPDYLLVHLRMSGDLYTENATKPLNPHIRMAWNLDHDVRLSFEDTRKFGRVWLVPDPEMVTADLGPEPLAEDFTAQTLYALLQSKRRQIKPLLLDQRCIAGLGNIYTDEALFKARIHPQRKSDALSFEETEALWRGIRTALSAGIEKNGTSIDWIYRGGDYQKYLQVYKRTGDPCSQCGTPIKRILVGQRGTHFCPNCQKML